MGPVKVKNNINTCVIESLGIVAKRLLVVVTRILGRDPIDVEPTMFIHWYSNSIHVPAL